MKPKNYITIIILILSFSALSFKIKASTIRLNPIDSCYEIILENGNTIYADVIEINKEFVQYRNCGEVNTTPIQTISKKQIVAIKGITETEGKKKHYIATRTSKGNKEIKKIYFLYALSLIPYFLIKYFELNISGLWVYCFPILAVFFSILTLIEIRKIKHPFRLKSLLQILSYNQIIIPILYIILLKILFPI